MRSPGIELTQLQAGLPDYLRAIVELLRSDGGTELDESSSHAWAKVAREHGITRVHQGFDISQLIHEFMVLRQVIEDVIEASEGSLDGQGRILSDVLEAAIAAAVRAYVEARDFEIRRRQAEHIGFLTHELRSPLSTAFLAAGRLRAKATEAQIRALDLLDRSHRQLMEMIDGVLLTQSLEAGKAEIRPVPLDVGRLLEGLLDGVRAAAAEKRLDLRTRFDPATVLCVDPRLTRSALKNLLENAVKYTDHGYVELHVEPSESEVSFHVRDSCNGISPDELATIFQPFERGRNGTSGKSGSGLGLAIARRAVEAQGGSIQAESPGPAGCHFWITLPKCPKDPAALEHDAGSEHVF